METELQILDLIQKLRTPAGDVIMKLITILGNAGIVWILLAVLLLVRAKTRESGVMLALALALNALICNVVIKNIVARVRPCDVNTAISLLIDRPKDYSFPSGHTAISVAAVTALYFAGEKKMWKWALLLTVLIAFSRMYLYVHYPTDILGGILAGFTAGYASYRIVGKEHNK